MQKNIRINNIKNSISIVDRDWEGMVSSFLPDARLVYTFGYSWENDFWTKSLIVQTLRELMPAVRKLREEDVKKMIDRAAHRLARLSKIDYISKLHGVKFIPSSKKSPGVEIRPSHEFLAPIEDIRKFNVNVQKIRNSVKNCSVSKKMYRIIFNESSERIIRGHLWEFLSICIVSHFFRLLSGEKNAPKYIVKGAAFNAFSRAANRLLAPDVAGHYKNKIESALIAATS